jgi:hypothetical protein
MHRYYPANQQALENIKRQCLYFGSVEAFNDPFECQICRTSANDDPAVVQMLRDRYSLGSVFPEELREQVKTMDHSSFAELLKTTAIEVLAKFKEDFISNRGVVCFSETNENLLMWSHYADEHRGYVIEYEFPDGYNMLHDMFKGDV